MNIYIHKIYFIESVIYTMKSVQKEQTIKVIVVSMRIVAIIIWATVILSCFTVCRYKTTLCFEQYGFKVLAVVYPLSKYKSTMAWFIVFYTQHCYCYSCHRKERTKKKPKIKWKHWHLSTFHFIAFDWIFSSSDIHWPLFTFSRHIHVLAPYIAPNNIVFRFIFDSIHLIHYN